MGFAERGAGRFEIGHRINVEPGLRHCHHHIRPAKTEPFQHTEIGRPIRGKIVQQVFARHPEMQAAFDQALRDLARRKKPHFGVQPFDLRRIAPLPTDLAQRVTDTGEPGLGLFLQPPLGRDCNRQPAHAPALRTRTIRSGRTMPPIPVAETRPEDRPAIRPSHRPPAATGWLADRPSASTSNTKPS